MPLLNCEVSLALKLRKSTEYLIQGSRIVMDTNCCFELAALLGTAPTGLVSINHPRIVAGDFRQRLVRTSEFQVALNWSTKKRNPQILVNLPVTNAPRCVSRIAKTLRL
jgi:hypothetical protein